MKLASVAGVSATLISRLEHGRVGRVPLATLRSVFVALDARAILVVRWQGGEIDRLIDARHAALQDELARRLARLPDWIFEPEVTFSIYGERGSIDLVAWNPRHRALLIIEVKASLADVGGLLRQTDRYRRLAMDVARTRGWRPLVIGVWVVLADGRTARRRLADHRAVLRSSYPDDGHAAMRWLSQPTGPLRALSFLPIPTRTQVGRRPCLGASHGRRLNACQPTGSERI